MQDGSRVDLGSDSDDGDLSFSEDWCWEGDGPSSDRPCVASLQVDLGLGLLKRRAPRKGTAAEIAGRVTDPVNPNDPDSISILQACAAMAELSTRGATNASVTGMCQYAHHMLLHAQGDHPTSFHMVCEVLGRAEAESIEFLWCTGCGYRHPREHTHGIGRRCDLTCPTCGEPAFKV